MESIGRNIQIDLIMDNTNPIIDMFNKICENLSVIELDAYHKNGGELIYYNKDNKWVFYRDEGNERFWCNYDIYWKLFKNEFKLNYNEIQSLSKILIEDLLNKVLSKPSCAMRSPSNKLETIFKDKIGEPTTQLSSTIVNVLERNISTPRTNSVQTRLAIETALNNMKNGK